MPYDILRTSVYVIKLNKVALNFHRLIDGWLTDTFNCTIHAMSNRRMVRKW